MKFSRLYPLVMVLKVMEDSLILNVSRKPF